ncbi:hypothetical protein CZ774_14735 [Frigoribacterium sp. JB110]|nr:hypothetical protein CZ774_14735 [Frigoribacterium sp. JB110]
MGPFENDGAADLIAGIRHADKLSVSIGVPPRRMNEMRALLWRSDQP